MIHEAWNPKPATLHLVDQAAAVLEDFQSQGYDMTLRQLYYQLVAANVIPNTQRQYQRLSKVMTHARWAGMVPLDCLYDPGREPITPTSWESPQHIMDAVAKQYSTNRWRNGHAYVELWAEKDAVASVLRPVAREWQLTYQSARGFMGLGAMARARARIQHQVQEGKQVVILYCGDHDPSGQEIPRVVQDQLDRLCDFGDITVRVIALTGSQVDEHDPPPQPAKPTDARYWRYVEEHNMTDVWELDALPPDVLANIAQTAVEEWLPDDYRDIVESDTTTRGRLVELGAQL